MGKTSNKTVILGIVIAAVFISSSVFSLAYGELLQTFDDPTVTTVDFFGGSVARSGNNVLVGAFPDDTNGLDVGQAHLFDATTGALLLTFDDPTVTTRDFFGGSVSIDGNLVLVGASNDDTNGENIGQAYLYDITTCDADTSNGGSAGDKVCEAALLTFDDPTVTATDSFGQSVSISGTMVHVGTRFIGSESASLSHCITVIVVLRSAPNLFSIFSIITVISRMNEVSSALSQ